MCIWSNATENIKDCSPLGSLQHKLQHCCFYPWWPVSSNNYGSNHNSSSFILSAAGGIMTDDGEFINHFSAKKRKS